MKKIQKLINYAPHKELSATEKELIWKFRYYVSKNPKALPKFLRCIDWKDSINESQGVEMMRQWEPIEPADALELLSKEFKNIHVRKYAVGRLETAGDDEILSYLLQLVQTMGFERATGNTPLTDFLIKRASENFKLGNFFYWFVSPFSSSFDAFFTYKIFYSSLFSLPLPHPFSIILLILRYVTVEIGRAAGARSKLFRKKLSRFYLACVNIPSPFPPSFSLMLPSFPCFPPSFSLILPSSHISICLLFLPFQHSFPFLY